MVEIKKKVRLRSKVTEDSTLEFQSSNPNGSSSEGNFKWIVVAIILLLLIGGGYYLSQKSNDDTPTIADNSESHVQETEAIGVVSDETQVDQDYQEQKEMDPTMSNNGNDNSIIGTPMNEPVSEEKEQEEIPSVVSGTPAAKKVENTSKEKPIDNEVTDKPTLITSATETVENEAKKVIRGKYGNGNVRKKNLGESYAEIQNKVNEMYRNGQVH